MHTTISSPSFEQHYSQQLGAIVWPFDNPPPTFAEMRAHVLGLLEDDGDPVKEVGRFGDFEGFFSWFDTVTAYDQLDTEESAGDFRSLLEVVYQAICAGVA
ncbi:TPA: hypothetical protein ACP32N_005055 [Pseudomonas aeruginosa]